MFYLFLFSLQFILHVFSCPTGWLPSSVVQGKCYLFVKQKQAWLQAENYCENAATDGRLTSINNAFENTDILGKAQRQCDQYWIGLQDIEETGNFTWIDGRPLQYKGWDAEQPNTVDNNHCVSLNGQSNGKWITEYCGTTNCFVCETFQSSKTTSTTTVPTTTTSSTTILSTTTSSSTTTTTATSPTTSSKSMTDCYDWFHSGGARSDGIYEIEIPGTTHPLSVWCDMTTDGGGWTVFQRRINGDLSFYDKTWDHYKYGFNNGLDKNLWLGNEYIHLLTTKDANVYLRMYMLNDRRPGAPYPNIQLWLKQSSFYIDSEANDYTLHLNTAGDGNVVWSAINANIGAPFSTIDNNHDSCHGCCTKPPYDFGGWWLYNCTSSPFYTSLNGKYIPPDWQNGFRWLSYWGFTFPAQSGMMLRKLP